MINDTDADGNSRVNLPELPPLMVGKVKDTCTEEELDEAFKGFDHDDNGFSNADESPRRTTNVGEEVAFLSRKREMTCTKRARSRSAAWTALAGIRSRRSRII